VVAVIWLLVSAVIVGVVVLLLVALIVLVGPSPQEEESELKAAVAVHEVHQRFELAQFKSELRRDAARVRRELSHDLDRLDRRERRLR
jgi:hypothetical protein